MSNGKNVFAFKKNLINVSQSDFECLKQFCTVQCPLSACTEQVPRIGFSLLKFSLKNM